MLDRQNRTGLVVMTNEVGETTYNYGLVSLIFGDCRTETGFTYDDLSGIYCNSRANYSKSFVKLFSMISGLLPVTKGETEESYQAAMVGSITQISENACIMDDGNGLKTYLRIKRDSNGNVAALQHMTGMDFQKENTAVFVIKIIIFFLFVLSSFWTLIMLIVHGITLHKYKQTEIWRKKLYQLLAELFIVLASILIYWLILPPLMGGSFTKTQVAIKCTLIILCTFMEIVMLLIEWFGVKNMGNIKNNLRQKIGFTVTKVSGILLIANVLYWHFYQFWGC